MIREFQVQAVDRAMIAEVSACLAVAAVSGQDHYFSI